MLPKARLDCLTEMLLVYAEPPQGTAVGRLAEWGMGSCLSKVAVFKGIPYALPPIGERRWKPAEPALDWLGERRALQFSPACPQLMEDNQKSLFYSPALQTSEDCLYLNVWTSAVKASRKICGDSLLPVMVWIHGGGLLQGSASEPVFDGEMLASQGVVVVSINYRLGVLGYFSHPELSAESPLGVSGNYGITDQIQALKWVKRNISAFGGDPDNVTVFGQSAGALSISHLMCSRLAEGLFHKAIMQSAYMPAMPQLKSNTFGMPPAETYGQKFSQSLFDPGQSFSLAELRNIPAAALVDASTDYEFDKPVIDGWVFNEQIFETFEAGRQSPIPLLAGITSHECSYFITEGYVDVPVSKEQYETAVRHRYKELSQEYLSEYPASDMEYAAYAPIGHGLYGWATQSIASMMQKVDMPCFIYCFSHAPAWAKSKGLYAFHTLDLLYSFNNVDKNSKYAINWPDLEPTPNDIKMAKAMSSYWVSFAYHGKPTVSGLPDWPDYEGGKGQWMWFENGEALVGNMPAESAFSLHKKIVHQRREAQQPWTYADIGIMSLKINE